MSETVTLDSIPHRPPFRLLDRIVEVNDDRIRATWFVSPDWDILRGHYPDRPVVPGVLLCESCFQAGALLITHRLGAAALSDGIPVLTRIRDARFRRMVQPGETIDIEVVIDDVLDNAYFLTGRVTVGGELSVRVTFGCALIPDQETEA